MTDPADFHLELNPYDAPGFDWVQISTSDTTHGTDVSLAIGDPNGDARTYLDLDQARQVRDALDAAIKAVEAAKLGARPTVAAIKAKLRGYGLAELLLASATPRRPRFALTLCFDTAANCHAWCVHSPNALENCVDTKRAGNKVALVTWEGLDRLHDGLVELIAKWPKGATLEEAP